MGAQVTGTRRERWLIGENDYGGPMVEHLHPGGSAVAYVLLARDGREFAQCTACGGRKSLSTGSAAPRAS